MNYVYDDGGVYIKNLANRGEKYGISQYRFAHNYELEGGDFTISAGDKKHKLAFKSAYSRQVVRLFHSMLSSCSGDVVHPIGAKRRWLLK